MTLEDQISKYAAKVYTTSYSMSVGELLSLYRDGEIDVHPAFQRFFRWSVEQKSRLIESLLLGIPIPPIFIAERGNQCWDVIDGLQRISTVLEVMGELRNEEQATCAPLVLTKTRYLGELEGKQWRCPENPDRELSESVKLRIKRARIDINLIKSNSDELVKYEIFQRLNAGASIATDQEVRNCLLLMANREFFDWFQELGKDEAFRACVPWTERNDEEQYGLELVTRFLVLANSTIDELKGIHELGAFLTDRILDFADSNRPSAEGRVFDRSANSKAFKDTFSFLRDAVEINSFRRFVNEKYSGAMLISNFEVIAIGIGYALLNGKQIPDVTPFLAMHKSLWDSGNREFLDYVGSGVRASTRIPKTIALGRAKFCV